MNIGDTIKCHDKDDLVDTMQELMECGIETDFLYEKDGVKGWWLVVVNGEARNDMTNTELLAENIRNYLESDVDLLLADDDYRTIIKVLEQEPILDKIKAEIEQAADKEFQIAMGIADLNERYTHIQMENAYRHSLNIIDKYKTESEE